MQNHRPRKSRSQSIFRNATTAPRWAGQPMRRTREEVGDDAPGWQVAKLASGALAAAFTCAFVARRNWLPAKIITGAVATIGAVLAAASGSNTLRAVGSGAMAWTVGELGLGLVDDLVRRRFRAQVGHAATLAEPATTVGLPPGALEAAFARARARLEMLRVCGALPREPDRAQDSRRGTNQDSGAELAWRVPDAQCDPRRTAEEHVDLSVRCSVDQLANDGARGEPAGPSARDRARTRPSNMRTVIAHRPMIAEVAAVSQSPRPPSAGDVYEPATVDPALPQTRSEIANASTQCAHRCSAFDDLGSQPCSTATRAPGAARGGPVNTDAGSFHLSLDRTIRTPRASQVWP